jgi:hypothetical protein
MEALFVKIFATALALSQVATAPESPAKGATPVAMHELSPTSSYDLKSNIQVSVNAL